MVHSHLLYGTVICGNMYNNHLKRIIILQNKAVKIVAGGQRQDHVTPFYHRKEILKLKVLYKYENYCIKTHGKSYRIAKIVTSLLLERCTHEQHVSLYMNLTYIYQG